MADTWRLALDAPRVAISSCLLLLALLGCAPEEAPIVRGDWPMVRADLAGTGSSPLARITVENVANLSQVWRYPLASQPVASDEEPRSAYSQATPIVVGDVMFLPTADAVVAIEPTTGQEIWRHALVEGTPSRRGVAYWPGEQGAGARIVFTAATRLIALDAATGSPVAEFGSQGKGEIDMGIPYNSVPLVWENTVVVGANTPRGAPGGIGNARAFDARTGEKRWEFSSVPQPGDVGHDSWQGDSWQGRLGVNAWPFYFTMDEQRGHVYLPLAAPVPFAYGGDRPGANLFANSVVAVDIETGAYVWHFQTIHHDLWDHDPPAPPALFDIRQPNGDSISALALTTKSGYLYILNRDTGEPLFGAPERPVPTSDVPGEHSYPTQPIPTHPPALARVSYQPSDLVTAEDTSSEHAAACRTLIESSGELENAGPFTPWAYRSGEGSNRTTLLFPGLVGGHNWGGVAFDPTTELLFAFSQDVGTLGWIEPAPEGAPLPYVLGMPRPASFDVAMGEQRWPCQKPPWGRLSAVSAATGEIAWQVPLGLTAGLSADRSSTGRPGRAGAIVTAGGLVFIASTDDNRFRALEAATGRELWATELDRPGNANPMTYRGADGHQYVAIVATEAVVAFRLP